MDSTIINIRVLDWHFQIQRDTWKPRLSRNAYHRLHGWPDGKWRVYRFGSYVY